jgi:CubicO group peptidase (beta-lactamase class C family)
MRMTTRLAAVVASVLLLWPPAARGDSIDDFAAAQLARHHVPGMAVAVVKDGKPVKVKGYGLADVGRNVPVTSETVFQLASVTKQFTAAAVMLLVEDGKVSLEDPVSRHVDDLPEAWRNVTVRQLLNHTSGIPSYTSSPKYERMSFDDVKPEDVFKLVRDKPLEFEPGARHVYSNTGYYLLGMVVGRAGGRPYGQFVAERIFRPLGMDRSRLNDLKADIPDRALGYSLRDEKARPARSPSMTWPFAAGALASTAADMAKWVATLPEAKVISRESLEQCWTRATLNDGKTADYGFGWQVGEHRGKRTVFHGGGIPGFATMVLLFPDDRMGVVVLMNADGANPDDVAHGIAALIDPAYAKAPPKPAIEDKDPKVTALLRDVLKRGADGTLDGGPFTPQLWQMVSESMKAQPEAIKSLGKLESVDLLERSEKDGMRTFDYRATFAHRTLHIGLDVGADGKIARMQLSPG